MTDKDIFDEKNMKENWGPFANQESAPPKKSLLTKILRLVSCTNGRFKEVEYLGINLKPILRGAIIGSLILGYTSENAVGYLAGIVIGMGIDALQDMQRTHGLRKMHDFNPKKYEKRKKFYQKLGLVD